MLHQTYKEQQESEMMQGLRHWYATRNEPKAPTPPRNELAEFNRAMERHAASENAKQRHDLEAVFAKRNALRATKSK